MAIVERPFKYLSTNKHNLQAVLGMALYEFGSTTLSRTNLCVLCSLPLILALFLVQQVHCDNKGPINQTLYYRAARNGLFGDKIQQREPCGLAPLNSLTKDPRRGSTTTRIINGETINPGEWPSYAHLLIGTRVNILFYKYGQCGGVLISEQHVLTAAHCWTVPGEGKQKRTDINQSNLNDFSISFVLGEYRARWGEEFDQKHTVKKLCKSSLFREDERKDGYDYAIATLSKPVELSDYVRPACLPLNCGRYIKTVGPQSKCFAIGLGVTKILQDGSKVENADYVQKLQSQEVDCKSVKREQQHRSCFKGIKPDSSTCYGDSGGPMLCLDEMNRWTVVGLAMSVEANCPEGHPTYFNDVRTTLKQILQDCKIGLADLPPTRWG